jgi:hypothetical protein
VHRDRITVVAVAADAEIERGARGSRDVSAALSPLILIGERIAVRIMGDEVGPLS